jgi:alpha-tubulin suppressor-like RCC1 family protein
VDALRGVGVRQIACGSGHTVVLTTEGEVFTWGRGDDGRLGKCRAVLVVDCTVEGMRDEKQAPFCFALPGSIAKGMYVDVDVLTTIIFFFLLSQGME